MLPPIALLHEFRQLGRLLLDETLHVRQTRFGHLTGLIRALCLRLGFGAARGARFILVSAVWARRYLRPEVPPGAGRVYSKIQQGDFADADARGWFAGLRDGSRGYRLVHASVYDGAIWPAIHIHDSLAETIWIYERVS